MGTKIYNRASYCTSGTAGEQALACPKSMFQQCYPKTLMQMEGERIHLLDFIILIHVN